MPNGRGTMPTYASSRLSIKLSSEQTDEIQNQVSQTLGEINSLSNRVALARFEKNLKTLQTVFS